MDRDAVLRLVTYNIHGSRGRSGTSRPDRIVRVLREIDADIIALQEVGGRGANRQLARIGERLQYDYAGALTIPPGYGNALLSRHPLRDVQRWDLTVGRREPRNAMVARVHIEGHGHLTVVNTHLGLQARERRAQLTRLLAELDPMLGPLVVMGDFNEWARAARTLRWMSQRFGASGAPRSYPAWRPWVGLDRVWVRPHRALISVASWGSARARRASDHLPVVAVVDKRHLPVANCVDSA